MQNEFLLAEVALNTFSIVSIIAQEWKLAAYRAALYGSVKGTPPWVLRRLLHSYSQCGRLECGNEPMILAVTCSLGQLYAFTAFEIEAIHVIVVVSVYRRTFSVCFQLHRSLIHSVVRQCQ